jgi:hypothetical protein
MHKLILDILEWVLKKDNYSSSITTLDILAKEGLILLSTSGLMELVLQLDLNQEQLHTPLINFQILPIGIMMAHQLGKLQLTILRLSLSQLLSSPIHSESKAMSLLCVKHTSGLMTNLLHWSQQILTLDTSLNKFLMQ